MKNKQVTAIFLAVVMTLSSCMSMSSVTAFAAENSAMESTENAEEEELVTENPDESEVQEETNTDSENPGEQTSSNPSDPEVMSEDPEEVSDEDSDITEAEINDEADSEDASNAITDGETASEDVIEETIEQVEKKQAALAEGVVASGTCGKNATWTLTGTEDAYTLTISGTGDTDISIVSSQWDEYYQNIETVIIEDGINEIGKELFEGFSSLQNISVPNSVTSIGSTAFKMCNSLQSIIIPDGVTRIETFTFNGCESLQNISIPNSVTYIGQNAFEGCSSLQNISIPNSVTYIGTNVFLGCSSLQDIIIPDGVETIKYCTFKECSSIQSITLPNSLIGIEFSAFENCNSLQNITIPGSVTNIDTRAFKNCESLQNIVIPNSVTSIGIGAFERCKSLQSVVLPDSISCIEKESFLKCTKLQNITIPDSVTSIDVDAFGECESLQNINIPDSVTIIGYGAFYGCTKIQSITIPDGVGAIGSRTFQGCVNLKSISIPKSVTSIGNRVFEFCYRIKDIYYDGTKAEWDKIDGSTFYLDINGLLLHTSDGVFGAISAEDITLNKTSATLVKGKTIQLRATVTPAEATDGKVTWKSSNTKVATVTSGGNVKAVSAGTATITAVTEGGLKATCKILIPYKIKFIKNATKATLTTTSKNVTPGKTIGKVTPTYSGYYFEGWYTAAKGGTKISESTKPTKDMTLFAHWVECKSIKKATVKVEPCMYTGKWCRPSVTVKLGTKTLKKYEDYSISCSNCVEAGSKGVIKITGKGRYKDSISQRFTVSKCSMGEKYISAELSKTTYNYTGKAIKPGITVYLNGRNKLTKGKDYKVTYKNNIEPGKATVQITGMGNFESKSRYFTFTIAKLNQPIKLSKSLLSLQYKNIGTTYYVTATGVKENAGLTVSSTNKSVATVSGSKGKYKIKIKGVGKANIEFKTSKATKHYKKTTKKLSITVADRKTPTISIPQQTYELRKGDAAFNIGATCDSDGALTYTSSDTDIVTVDQNGTVTITGNKEGPVVITVTSKATQNYKEGNAVVNITVIITPIWELRMYQFRDDDRWNGKGDSSWGNLQKPKLSKNRGGTSGCAAYVQDFVAYVYGRRNTTEDEVTRIDGTAEDTDPDTDISTIKVGDVVKFISSTEEDHYFAVISIDSEGTMYTMEGNKGHKICTGTTRYRIHDGRLQESFDDGVNWSNRTVLWIKHFNKWREDN